MEKSISLIVPAYNEELTLESSIRSAQKKLQEHNFDYEILIFDDCSYDETSQIADKLASEDPKIQVFHNSKNMNLGFNFSRGIELATKTYCGLLPCHGLIDPRSFDSILTALDKADVIVAYIANPNLRSISRRFISHVNVVLLNLIFAMDLKYYHLNFYRTDILKKIPTSTKSYALMVELLIYAIKSGAVFLQVPFFHKKRLVGKSKALRLKNILNILKTYIRLFWKIRVLRKRIDLN